MHGASPIRTPQAAHEDNKAPRTLNFSPVIEELQPTDTQDLPRRISREYPVTPDLHSGMKLSGIFKPLRLSKLSRKEGWKKVLKSDIKQGLKYLNASALMA